MENVDTATINIDLIKHLRISSYNSYMFYNVDSSGKYNIIGYFNHKDLLLGDELSPPITFKQRSFLDNVSKYYNPDSVIFLGIYGVAGVCIMADNDIWIIDGNKRMDLKSYIKDEYPNLSTFRYDFLIREKHWLSKNIIWQ